MMIFKKSNTFNFFVFEFFFAQIDLFTDICILDNAKIQGSIFIELENIQLYELTGRFD